MSKALTTSNVENAAAAFDVVKSAYDVLKEDVSRKHTADLVEAGCMRARAAHEAAKKTKGAEVERLEDMEKKEVMKLFAEIEMKRRDVESRKQAQKKRERDQEDEELAKIRKEMNFEKNWKQEDRVEGRVEGWRDFGAKVKKPKFDK